MQYTFSEKVSHLQASAIREILKFTSVPGVISFAAGNPAPEAFPVETIREISAEILEKDPIALLQYGITEGYLPLRDLMKKRMELQGNFKPDTEELIITSGAQQVMELACKSLCNAGDTLICEAPSFIGSLNAFKSYNVNLVGVPLDEEGMNPELLEEALKANPNTKLIYLIPNFQNPTGKTTSFARRKVLYALAQKYNTIILEDNPYGDLRFAGENVPTIKSLDTDNRVIYAGSFSKVLSPGIRVGYGIAPKEIMAKMVVCKQVSDVHTSNYGQMLAYEFMQKVDFDAHLANLRAIYQQKAERMLSGIENYFSDKIAYTRPEGGLFLWCTLPEGSDMTGFCQKAVQEYKIAVVPGNAFMVSESDITYSFRLNYSTPTDDAIDKGIAILGQLTKNMFD
ncbi:MAG: PLP-dependent aminotransferase family protein [Oscillospiraceae bacterium]|nr:PLP-dependent aminotransferase family protein [Oscillospiraceae bacterium]MDE6777113.1 PLP-dependent aminotransferase family protein [Oscillospiraceae bacterium]